ncbi:conserved Plasmodium protein, unknown function [Plasmodium malariae]|uniref:S1 motif domain-containing protein n=1 Tax=Plasmodium malariae TaxID=5858 RepID=A0A1C3K9M2_PLAMA|nr:conserved Plasmodium protein, unknown function [Plasmodium malariae]
MPPIFFSFFVVVVNLAYSINIKVIKNPLFINTTYNDNITRWNNTKSKNEKKKKKKSFLRKSSTKQSNIIYKLVKEDKDPFKKYMIDDMYYGRILSINKKKIKLDILCDRKAYLNTSEYFSVQDFNKYIFTLLQVHNIIKVKIKRIEKIHQKITVCIKKYSYQQILSSFKNDHHLIKSKILDIRENYLLLYLAPKIHAKLMLHGKEDLSNYKIGNDIPVKVDYFDGDNNELYVKIQ